ncbi:GNAT family N-acetyltransferase [Lederbergia wuyishanensis]|uniref:GNAT superfamily N-acetyltransferase n=1 Tax=Lederbergia wuyishanensis TaxID=1347903 RepID=A0ABU0D7V5_9BACI|nr:GNAT family N-acetyltransferase [Lederbergia wuyishanensis]MCJ8009140.1 GNAT family N-acetyltransferase [Lederbergia wuyishanensis]MDQ0344480.1 GNAT superfamily N-acetyltransferase [Lederbergia wuyishanensis]
MNFRIDRLPFIGNETILTEYWKNHIPEWKMEATSILYFAKEAAEQIWIYIAFKENDVCGILVSEETEKSALWLFHVKEEYRNNGIGTILFECALKNAGDQWTAGIGSGYWWQGVPLGCGDHFLEKKGFHWTWTSIDMLMSLKKWQVPDLETNINIGSLIPHENIELIGLLQSEAELSGWVRYYQNMIDNSSFDKIIVARSYDTIVGCAMVLHEEEIRWKSMIEGKVGGVGCLGVGKKYREQGIGASLVNAVNKELKKLGYTHSYIGYTYLENWYGKMGYEVYNCQRMGFMARNHN